MRQQMSTTRRVAVGGLSLGFGGGGLIDGIVLHEILRWHHVVSDRTPATDFEGLDRNVFWDGLFHGATAVVAAAGVVLLLSSSRSGQRSFGPGRRIAGLALAGWGAFLVADHVVFHLALGLHDIREDVDNPGVWNWAVAAIGIALIGAGVALLSGPRRIHRHHPRPRHVRDWR